MQRRKDQAFAGIESTAAAHSQCRCRVITRRPLERQARQNDPRKPPRHHMTRGPPGWRSPLRKTAAVQYP